MLRINQLLKLNGETQQGNLEVPVWNLHILLRCVGKCPCTCWKCQDSGRWNARPFHTGRAILWPDTPGTLQHRARHQQPQSACPASFTWPCHLTTATYWPYPLITYVLTLSPNYLCWHPRNNLQFHLCYKPSAFTKVWHLKWYDRAIGSCQAFRTQEPFSYQKVVSYGSTYPLWSSA